VTEEKEGAQFSTDIAFAYDSEKIHENASERIACALVELGNRDLLNTMLECHTLSGEWQSFDQLFKWIQSCIT
jgi:hypothetical protein